MMNHSNQQLAMFNGDLIHTGETRIPIQSDAVMYGVGLFETMRTYHQKSMPFLTTHINRLMTSLSALNVACDYSKQQLVDMVFHLVNEHTADQQRVKLVVNPEGVYIQSNTLVDEPMQGMKLLSHEGKRSLAEHKTTSYLDCYLAWQAANKKGYDDALLIDSAGKVYETSRANVFWVKDGELYTRKSEVLPGIMRNFVISQSANTVRYNNISLSDLLTADEVFITNSIKGIVPVVQIDEHKFTDHKKADIFSECLHDFVIKQV